MTSDNPPALIIVSGSPASGKSSIAVDLANAMTLPLLSRDDFKEAIMDVIPVDDVEQSHIVGSAAFVAMYRVLDRLLDAGVGAVLESTFERGRSETDLASRIERAQSVQVHCFADAATLKDRLAERISTGGRHSGHQDHIAYVEIESALADGEYDALDLNIGLIAIDTSNDRPVDIDAVLDQIGQHLR